MAFTPEQMEAAADCETLGTYAERMRSAKDAPTRRMHAKTVLARLEALRQRFGSGADAMLARYSAKHMGGEIAAAELERTAREALKGNAPAAYGPGRRDWTHEVDASMQELEAAQQAR